MDFEYVVNSADNWPNFASVDCYICVKEREYFPVISVKRRRI